MKDTKRPHLLLVEDSTVQAQMITTYLKHQGYPIQVTPTVQAASQRLSGIDIVILDVLLPDGSGYDVLYHIREKGLPLKVLMLSQLGEVPDRVRGLKSGADDYLPKPFDLTELEARIQSLWRQHRPPPTLRVGGWTIHHENLQVDLGNKTVQLTEQELRVLLRLAEDPGMPVRRDDLFRDVWKNGEEVGPRIIDVRIHGLRQKLGEETIETLRGLGYRLVTPQA